jgi:hypothetical protein
MYHAFGNDGNLRGQSLLTRPLHLTHYQITYVIIFFSSRIPHFPPLTLARVGTISLISMATPAIAFISPNPDWISAFCITLMLAYPLLLIAIVLPYTEQNRLRVVLQLSVALPLIAVSALISWILYIKRKDLLVIEV